MVVALTALVIAAGLSLPASPASATVVLPGANAAAWPTTWTDYTMASGAQISDVNNDMNPPYLDLASGACPAGSPTKCTGPASTVAFASDGTNAFFRMRMAAYDNNTTTAGGLFGGAFLVQLADANGVTRAVVGVDGTDSSSDYVYVGAAGASTSSVTKVYAYPFTGGTPSSAAMRWTPVGDATGQYYLDFQVPISAIATASGNTLTASTPIKLYYGSSAAAALSTVNKDFMLGDVSVVDFTDLGVVKLVSPVVTFNSQGGTAVPSQTLTGSTLTATQPAAPTRAGYAFDGWYTAATGGTLWDFSTTISSDLTLYAQWKPTYTVSFDSQGGSSVSSQTVVTGGKATKPTDPTWTGHTFDGWWTTPTTGGSQWSFSTDTVTGNTTLYARWSVSRYVVSFDLNGAPGTAPADQDVAYGGTVTEPADPTRPGYDFTGWYTAATGGTAWNFATDTVTGTTTLHAHWTVTPTASLKLDLTAGAIDDLDSNGPDAGDTITYSYTVTNTGDLDLGPVVVHDPLFGGSSPNVTCPSGTLAPGASMTCTSRVYTLTQADVDAGEVHNTATATGTTAGGGTVTDDSSTLTTLVATTSNVRVTKTVDNPSPRVGDVVRYTLVVTNDGPAAADDVVLTDVLPSGVTLVSAETPCTATGAAVTCAFGALAAGESQTVTVRATVDPLPAAGSSAQHWIDVQKTEAQLDLEAGQQQTLSVSCAPGYVMTDGSARIDAVDQDTGTLASPNVIESRAVGLDTWQVTAVNEATGRAQAKVFGLCVRKQTEAVDGHTHELQVGEVVSQTQAIVGGHATVTLSCAAGQVPVQPGFQLDGTARVPTSYPSGADGWTFDVGAGPDDTATNATFMIRCLDRALTEAAGHHHVLDLAEVRQPVVVQPGQVTEVTLSCAVDAKGIVAGHDLQPGLVDLGNDPRPIIRVFKLFNPTTEPLGADLWLLCLGNRTAGGGSATIVNTAAATTSTPETTTADNSDTAEIVVDTSALTTGTLTLTVPTVTVVAGARVRAAVRCAAGGAACDGKAVLVAARTQRLHGVLVRKGRALARTSYSIGAASRVTLVLRPTAIGRKALRATALRTAKMRVAGTKQWVRIRR